MTRQILLTQGQIALIDDQDYELVSRYRWYAKWDKSTQGFYAIRNTPTVNGKRTTVRMHTFLMGGATDHVNHDTLDNRRRNLRLATKSQNGANRRINRNNSSGYRGVHWDRRNKRWRASISHDGHRRSLGYFDDLKNAAQAYDNAARVLFGEFAYLNFPEEQRKRLEHLEIRILYRKASREEIQEAVMLRKLFQGRAGSMTQDSSGIT